LDAPGDAKNPSKQRRASQKAASGFSSAHFRATSNALGSALQKIENGEQNKMDVVNVIKKKVSPALAANRYQLDRRRSMKAGPDEKRRSSGFRAFWSSTEDVLSDISVAPGKMFETDLFAWRRYERKNTFEARDWFNKLF